MINIGMILIYLLALAIVFFYGGSKGYDAGYEDGYREGLLYRKDKFE